MENSLLLLFFLGHLTHSIGSAENTGRQISCSSQQWLGPVTLKQQLLKDGFHRELLIDVEAGGAAGVPEGCSLALVVHLPKGVYVDPYQLAMLKESNELEALVLNEVDVEAPEYFSSEVSVLVFTKRSSQCIGCFTSTLPLHARYHRPSTGGETHVTVILGNPQLMTRCQTVPVDLECPESVVKEAACTAENKTSCNWLLVNYKHVPKATILKVNGFGDPVNPHNKVRLLIKR
ncbi:phosphatidylinositol-glycan biosynthesis class X protein [Latimeria chalumnae]|uniref:phosphatidylinositol-glycan biosynthesis class X protein n=1 Tax=Latimeria chalumnae TaxID=7897 RepID=UPI00313E8219